MFIFSEIFEHFNTIQHWAKDLYLSTCFRFFLIVFTIRHKALVSLLKNIIALALFLPSGAFQRYCCQTSFKAPSGLIKIS